MIAAKLGPVGATFGSCKSQTWDFFFLNQLYKLKGIVRAIRIIPYLKAASVISANQRTPSYTVSSKQQEIKMNNNAPITMQLDYMNVDTAEAADVTVFT